MSLIGAILIIVLVFHLGVQNVIEEIGNLIREVIGLFKKD